MKKITLALTAFLGLTILTPTAQAGHNTRVSVDRCGYTVYSEYQFVGRDHHGCPVYQWVVVRRVPPCRQEVEYGHGSRYGGSYSSGGHYGGGYSGRSYGGHGGGCDYGSRGGNSIHFSWSR